MPHLAQILRRSFLRRQPVRAPQSQGRTCLAAVGGDRTGSQKDVEADDTLRTGAPPAGVHPHYRSRTGPGACRRAPARVREIGRDDRGRSRDRRRQARRPRAGRGDPFGKGIPRERMTGISIFDVDRTLTARPTYSLFLLNAAWRSAPWRLVLVPVIAL